MTILKNKFENFYIHIFLVIYSIFNLLTLTKFPLIHSDEAWLAGLTDNYLDYKTIFVTESFFDLMPRTLHTIKSFYHLLQLPFITLFGNTPFAIRLLSLLAAIITLYFFNKLFLSFKLSPIRALMYTIIFSLNLQFIYSAHFGRQEMILLMMLTICTYLYFSNQSIYKIAIILGLSIGFHPNAFIITVMIGSILIKDYLTKKSISFKQVIGFISIIGGFACLHIGFTLLANPDFFAEYWAYGQTLSVDALPTNRFVSLKNFYLKLYHQISGTYYIPPMKPLYLIGGFLSLIVFIISLLKKFTHQNKIVQLLLDALVMVIGYNIAIFVIGRYNTTSISFLLLPLYIIILLTLEVLYQFILDKSKLNHQTYKYIYYSLCMILALVSLQSFTSEYSATALNNFDAYMSNIQDNIDDDAVILGNLNSGFLFHNHTFYDIRNLAYINENTKYPQDTTIEAYINNRNINTIIYYEEYDYIHRNQQWEILYGDDALWYDDLQVFIAYKTTLVHEFDNMYYGSRIIGFLGDYPWKIYIYQVK